MKHEEAKQIGWPDTTIDQRAWEMAKLELGEGADSHALLQRAQQIKETLKKGEL